MVKVKIFDMVFADEELNDFIEDNNISREQIISICFAIDSDAPLRIGRRSVQQILFAWDDKK